MTGHECSEERGLVMSSQDEILSLVDSSPCMLRVLGGVPAKLSGREFCSSRRVIVVRVSLWESSLEVLSK